MLDLGQEVVKSGWAKPVQVFDEALAAEPKPRFAGAARIAMILRLPCGGCVCKLLPVESITISFRPRRAYTARRGFACLGQRSGTLPRASGALFNHFQPGAKAFDRVENLFCDFYPRWTIATLALCADGAKCDAARLGHLLFRDITLQKAVS
ncbi:MAG: hypothetical protein M3178_12630 [Pseudomonadota bacterium]|nr:hypothetical protein [Pseudomonadota bacterium]